jgi:hypothetical protein
MRRAIMIQHTGAGSLCGLYKQAVCEKIGVNPDNSPKTVSLRLPLLENRMSCLGN